MGRELQPKRMFFLILSEQSKLKLFKTAISMQNIFFKVYLQPCNCLIHSILQSPTEEQKFIRGDRLGTAFLQSNQ